MKAIVLISLLAACPPVFAGEDPYAPLERRTLVHDGVEREYFAYVPPGREGRLPVVLAIHGYLSTATGFAVFHDLRAHADENGYIVVYPQSTHFVAAGEAGPYRVTSWNMLAELTAEPTAGPQCIEDAFQYPCPPECGTCGRCGWVSCHDDVGFIAQLLDEIEHLYPADPRRYYALGMSNGGMMALRLGCSLSDRFAAIAPIDAQLPAGFNCAPNAPLPMLHLTAGKDDTVRPDGAPGSDGFIYVSAAETAASWARALRCGSGQVDWRTDTTERAGFQCTAYGDCKAQDRDVVSCVDPDETHNWPARRPGGAWPTCVTSQQAEAMPEQRRCERRTETGPHRGMDLIWEFFRHYKRPADAKASAG